MTAVNKVSTGPLWGGKALCGRGFGVERYRLQGCAQGNASLWSLGPATAGSLNSRGISMQPSLLGTDITFYHIHVIGPVHDNLLCV